MSRMEKLNQQLKREISSAILLGEVSDPRVRMVSITYADISKDLSVAHVGFSVMGQDQASIDIATQGLKSASGRIRSLIASRLEIRRMPELKFVYDESLLKVERTMQIIQETSMEDGSQQDDATLQEPSQEDDDETQD